MRGAKQSTQAPSLKGIKAEQDMRSLEGRDRRVWPATQVQETKTS